MSDIKTGSPAKPSKVLFWVGWVISILPVALLLASATMKFLRPPEVTEGMAKFGYAESVLTTLGVVELTCTALYLFPRTAVLGAILLTGYLGGATATHVRVADPYFAPILVGIALWLGLLLREPRLWPLLPLRKPVRA